MAVAGRKQEIHKDCAMQRKSLNEINNATAMQFLTSDDAIIATLLRLGQEN